MHSGRKKAFASTTSLKTKEILSGKIYQVKHVQNAMNLELGREILCLLKHRICFLFILLTYLKCLQSEKIVVSFHLLMNRLA